MDVIKRLFRNTVYIRVFADRFELRQVERGAHHVQPAVHSYSNKRLLIADFTVAEQLLREGMRALMAGRFNVVRPRVVIQPMAVLEQGLRKVEERMLRELAVAAGARDVIVWVGSGLSDRQVLALAGSRKGSSR